MVKVFIKGGSMTSARYDTFENETELEAMIKDLQSRSIDYMKRPDAWEVSEMTDPIKASKKIPALA